MFLKKKTGCSHDNVNSEVAGQYCPDCGRYIENKWYLTRCVCCNIKRKTVIKQNTLLPAGKFCPNCGAEGFYTEHVNNINFIDINFSVLKKEINGTKRYNGIQSWIEREQPPVRLLGMKS